MFDNKPKTKSELIFLLDLALTELEKISLILEKCELYLNTK